LQCQIDQFASLAQLLGHHLRIVHGPRRRVEPVGQRDEPLRDAVVDVACQPAPFDLLRLDHLLDEILVRAFAGHQLPVQPGLMQRARDQPADHQQQFDVALGELTAFNGVHVEDADQPAGVGLHRHRHHRREVLATQRFERHVPRIGLLVMTDHDGLAVTGHPSRDALPQRQPDLAHLGVERRCRTRERQRPLGVVEHMHEADVAGGGGGDHPGGRRGQRFDAGAFRGGLDQLAQQREFAVGGQLVLAEIAYRVGRTGSCAHW
jgi:hypothetical protein